jgi:hypothetical protein
MSGEGDETVKCQRCGSPAEWRWHDGRWSGGAFCSECIKDELETEASLPDRRDSITTAENVTTIDPSAPHRDPVRIIPAGAQPIGETYPVVRTVEALEQVTSEGVPA